MDGCAAQPRGRRRALADRRAADAEGTAGLTADQLAGRERTAGLTAVLSLALAAIAAATGARFLGALAWALDFPSFFVPHLLYLSAVLLAVATLARRWRIAGLAALVAALNLAGLALPAATPAAAAPATPLKVMSYNLLVDTRDTAPFFDLVRRERPDIVVVQEAFRPWKDAFRELRDLYPYSSAQLLGRRHTIVVLSRWPLLTGRAYDPIDAQAVEPLNATILELAIGRDGGPLDVIAVHAPTPRRPDWWEARSIYLEAVARRTAGRDPARPLVVAGDFNTPPWSVFFRRLLDEGGLVAATGSNWPAPTRIFREFGVPAWLGTVVDHILVSPGIGVVSYGVGPMLGSDHRPVTAELLIPQG